MTRKRHNKKVNLTRIPQKQYFSIASSDLDDYPSETSSPDSISTNQNAFFSNQATSDETPEPEDHQQLQATTPGVVREYLSGKLKIQPSLYILITLLGFILICGWMLIQDNGAGRLDTQEGINWYLVKIRYPAILSGVLIILIIIYGLITHKKKDT